MALVHCDYFSDVLQVGASMSVILPQATTSQIGVTGAGAGTSSAGGPPTLFLLHGLSDDHTAWTRYSSIERYVEPLGLAVVMPSVQRSFYCDQAHGGRYWEHLTRELPEVAGSFFHLSAERSTTFVAGLSMGGYGAVKWALQQPERFAAAASLSGSLDLAERQERGDLAPDVQDAVFGGRALRGTSDDLMALLDRSVRPADLPQLYVCCGTQDHLFPDNERFVAAAAARGVDVVHDFTPGEHEWGYWDVAIRAVLRWLPVP